MTDTTQALYDKHFNKAARLGNGSRVNLKTAASLWNALQTMSLHPQLKKDLLELRERAFTETAVADPKRRAELQNLGFLAADGRLTPDARDVVLSALNGELENTHVVSPFTDWTDRKLAELVSTVTTVKEAFRPDLSTRLLKEAIGADWVRRLQDKPPGRGGFSRN